MSLQDSNLVVDGVNYNTVGLFELVQAGMAYESIPITPPSGKNYNSTAYNIEDGHLYVGQGNKIWRIESDGSLTLVGTPGSNFRSGYVGDLDDRGLYYLQSGGASNLHVVDLDSPNSYTVLPITVNGTARRMSGADIAYNPRDQFLYVKGKNDDILKINRDTGVATVLVAVSSSPNGAAGGAWFDAAGFFYNYFNNGSIYRYDIENPNSDGTIPATFFANAFKVRTNDGAACAYRPTMTKTVTPNPGIPGEPVTYTINIFNVLPSDITANFEDALDGFPGGTWRNLIQNCRATDADGTEDSALCARLSPRLTDSSQTMQINGIEVPARGSIQFELVADTSSTRTPSSVCNQASLTNLVPDNPLYTPRFSGLSLLSDDPGLAGLEDETCHTFGTLDLSCSLSDNSGGVFTPGNTSTVTMTLTNNGTAKASQVGIVEILQSGGRINTSTFSPDDIQCSAQGANADTTCGAQIVATDRKSYELRDLGLSAQVGTTPGQLQLRIPVAFDANLSSANYTVTPEISVAGERFDDLCGSISFVREPEADLVSTKASYPDAASVTAGSAQNLYTPGEPTIYVVTVENKGPSNVTGATWEDQLPPEFEFSDFSFTCDCLQSGACTATAGTPDASNIMSGALSVPAKCEIRLEFDGTFSTTPNL